MGILFLVGVVMTGSFYWDSFVVAPEKEAPTIEFTIEEGAGVEMIGERLEKEAFITSAFFFKVYVKVFASPGALQAGTFSLRKGMSLQSVVAEMTHAEAKEIEVTIPEGWTATQIGERVVKEMPNVSKADWALMSGPQGKLMVAAQDVLTGIPSGQGLEGYLFPDTYRFREQADAKTVADTMLLTLKRRLAEQGVVIPESLTFENGMTLHEVLTLASIIEREVRSPEDMKKVAGIFFTRMKIGMALQADSTVNYVTGKNDPGVTLEDSRVSSPYNTYRNLGLPPGPISNPGVNAIMAVFHPVDSDAVYFLTTKEGEVIYANTFAQHIANKEKYLR